MDIRLNGKPLREVFPEAAKWFDSAEKLAALGFNELVNNLLDAKDARISELEKSLAQITSENKELAARLEEVQKKLSRPKSGKKPTPVAPPEIDDETTRELMEDAYTPKSKSEARRLQIMKESKRGK